MPPRSTGGSGGRKYHSRLAARVIGRLPAMAPGLTPIKWVTGEDLGASCAALAGRLHSIGERAAAEGISGCQRQQMQYAGKVLRAVV